jgi:hypothetical protein
MDAPLVETSSPGAASLRTWPGVVAALVAGLAFLALASRGSFRFGQSAYPHHVLIADAWLHGQLHVREEVLAERAGAFQRELRARVEASRAARGQTLADAEWERIRARNRPPVLHDWSVVDGKHYGYFSPLPAALLVPLVALFGLGASDVLVSCLLGAGTVFLAYDLLRQAARRGAFALETRAGVALALVLGLGTVHLYLTVVAHVWFLSQVVACFFLTLALTSVLRAERGVGWAAAAGAALGASFLARKSELATLPFFVWALWSASRSFGPAWRRELVQRALAFGLPLAAAALAQLAFNHARFGAWLEDGLRYQLESGANPRFIADYRAHGVFSLHWVPRNLWHYLANPFPVKRPDGAWSFDPDGNSLFLVTPALFLVLPALRARANLVRAAWLACACSMVVLLTFFGTGWYGFGNRYLLDLLPLALLLIAAGMRGRLTVLALLLCTASAAVNAWGLYRFVQEVG